MVLLPHVNRWQTQFRLAANTKTSEIEGPDMGSW